MNLGTQNLTEQTVAVEQQCITSHGLCIYSGTQVNWRELNCIELSSTDCGISNSNVGLRGSKKLGQILRD